MENIIYNKSLGYGCGSYDCKPCVAQGIGVVSMSPIDTPQPLLRGCGLQC